MSEIFRRILPMGIVGTALFLTGCAGGGSVSGSVFHPSSGSEQLVEMSLPHSKNKRVQHAIELINAGAHSYPQAIKKLDEALAEDPEDITALLARAFANELLGEFDAAAKDYRSALKYSEESFSINNLVAVGLLDSTIDRGALSIIIERIERVEEASHWTPNWQIPWFRFAHYPVPIEQFLSGKDPSTIYFSGMLRCDGSHPDAQQDNHHFADSMTEAKNLTESHGCTGWSVVGVASEVQSLVLRFRKETQRIEHSVFNATH